MGHQGWLATTTFGPGRQFSCQFIEGLVQGALQSNRIQVFIADNGVIKLTEKNEKGRRIKHGEKLA